MPSKKEQIRKARIREFSRIHKIIWENMKWDTPHKWIFVCKHVIRRDHLFYVCLVGNKVMGVAIVKECSNKEWYLAVLVIEKPFRRRGYGRRLLRFVKDQACRCNINRIRLRVNVASPAIRLYESEGFKPMTRHRALDSSITLYFDETRGESKARRDLHM